ncbi:unnamed protein product [Phyllotreta striolata]|uniref:Tetratricopeptide repeat protein 18 n=1 Tax=Phyllotreta striolata TaxID=444603 RepID=A0A9N9TH86_PHYSR|nr:unnamed protein product [Phyllotreta striolata]
MVSRLEKGSVKTFGSSKHSVRNEPFYIKETNIKIKIVIECCENIKPFFEFSDIQVKCLFGEEEIGQSRPFPITDAKIIKMDYPFEFQLKKKAKDFDSLATYPIFLMFDQIEATYDHKVYPQLQLNKEIKKLTPVKSFDSVVSLYEALSRTTSQDELDQKKKIVGPSKSNTFKNKEKAEKAEKAPLKTRKESKSSLTKVLLPSVTRSGASLESGSYNIQRFAAFDPISFGMCTIDLVPLLLGSTKVTQCQLIRPITEYMDEKMNSYKSHPRVTVTVSTSEDLDLKDITFLNFTIETIYNIPQHFIKPNFDYKFCCVLPSINEHKIPMVFTNPVFTNQTVNNISKCWPGIQRLGNDTNTTQYRTSEDLKDIVVKFDNKVEQYITGESLRIQFVMIKRHLMSKDSICDLTVHVKKYRKIALEFLISPKGLTTEATTTKILQSSKKSMLSTQFFHYMALIDVSSLLYPGVMKLRVATQLQTFNLEKAFKEAGLEESFFMQDMKITHARSSRLNEIEKPGKDDKEASMKNKAPAAPKPDENDDDDFLYDDEERPCFVVVELELTHPLIPKREIEDLKASLAEIIKSKHELPPDLPKVVLTSCITVDYFKELINGMVNDLNNKYMLYIEENNMYPKGMDRNGSFVDYLKKKGIYESYINSMSKVITMLMGNKFHLEDSQATVQYQKLIGDLFVFLISEMNGTVNKLICHGMDPVTDIKRVENNLFFAKEALETNRIEIADRYLLENLCYDRENLEYWFHYGLFLLQTDQEDKAFECFREALSKNQNHKYCILLVAAHLCKKNQLEEAESCLLVLMNKAFSWLEGWGVLYLFYYKTNNFEGMDMAMKNAKKYFTANLSKQDAFMESDELIWTPAIIPNTIFFRTAVLLLKCRLYEWCELALSQEVNNTSGLVHYLLSVISYYKKSYDHALDHIDETKRVYGPDYAVASLAGHCYLALDKKEEAKQQYYWAMEFFNRPDSMHLVSIQLAIILNDFGNDQEARKLALLACKYSPTPYTWLLAGKYYLLQNDLVSAEECLCEGNAMDNRYAEIWGYLSLVNAKMRRADEAEICFKQAIRNNLVDQKLKVNIINELSNFGREDFLHVY